MNKDEKKQLRGILFRHLDGIAIGPTIAALYKKGICAYIQGNSHFTFQNITKEFKVNEGYLNVGLRLLASQGWLDRVIIKDGKDIDFNITEKGKKVFPLFSKYVDFFSFMPASINLDPYLFNNKHFPHIDTLTSLITNLDNAKKQYNSIGTPEWETIIHLEGMIAGPFLVAFGMSNFFTDIIINKKNITKELKNTSPLLQLCLDLFSTIDWIKNDRFTKKGEFFLKRASAYGVTVSYLPTFIETPALIYGNPSRLWDKQKDGAESHVNRRMNVWGSGGAHSIYFKKIDEIIINIFNQPLKEQPLGIADMGCGDGTLLKHLYNVVKNNTLRGMHLKENPLKILGADFNRAARLASTITLSDANIEHSILAGDISDPTLYAKNLKTEFGLDLKDMLNVRSFLDHNRIYSPPKHSYEKRECNSTGAFAYKGEWIKNTDLKQNLIEHFNKWKKVIGKFGLLILELHTIDPIITAQSLGRNVATAYDGTHGYSDQYIFEVETYLAAAKDAGLTSILEHQAFFPNEKIATISINLFQHQN